MVKKKKAATLNEFVEDVLYRSKYNVNEEVRYQQVVEDSEFDDLPPEAMGEGSADPEGNEEVTDMPVDDGEELPVEEPAADVAPEEPAMPEETPEDVPLEEPELGTELGVEEDPLAPVEPTVDELQNEVIKSNIAAMQSINDKLHSFDQYAKYLESLVMKLNGKVEEVEEPSNVEKLMAQKEVSYPFYFNLNDYWKGDQLDQIGGPKSNSVEGQPSNVDGITQLPDGSYVANFDDLDVTNRFDINSTFDKMS